jgi:hypothetical protein
MRKAIRWLAGLVIAFSLSLAFPVHALASVPAVYDQSLYVGSSWSSAGTYSDSVPGEDSADTDGEIVANANNASAVFQEVEIEGSLPSGDSITVTAYAYGANGGTAGTTWTLTSADVGKEVALPSDVTDAWGLSFLSNASSSSPGEWWLKYTWSTDRELSSTGEILWVTPTWANSPGTSAPSPGSSGPGVTATTGTSVSGGTTYVTTHVSVYYPPPDWNAITSEVAQKIGALFPPIPAPPTDTDEISASSSITPPEVPGPPALNVPTIVVPSDPPEPGTESVNLLQGFTPIEVPMSSSQAFNIQDPLASLPHTSASAPPVPGQSGIVGFTPSAPTLLTASPLPGFTAPGAALGPGYAPPGTAPMGIMPNFSGPSEAGGGPVPVITGSASGEMPLPGESGEPTPGYTVGGGTSGPSYDFGGGG